MTTPSISRGFAVLSFGLVVSRLLAFAVVIHLSRVLGREGFGVIVLATSILAYGAIVVELGFDTLGPIEVARGEVAVAALARAVVGMRLVLLAGGLAVVALLAWLAPLSPRARVAVLVYGASLFVNVFDLSWVFVGRHRMGPVAAAEIAGQALQAAGAFMLVREPEHLLRMPLVFVASRLATVAGLALAYCRSDGMLGWGLDVPLVRRLLGASVPLSAAGTLGTLVQSFDTVLLGFWSGPAAAGVYGAASRVAWVPAMIATAYFTSLRPALARGAAQGGFPVVAPILSRSLRIAGALGIGIATGGGMLAGPIVLFLYGSEFAEAAAPLRLLLVSVALLLISRHYRALLQAFRRPGLDLRIMAAAAVANVALNLLLVPRAGLVGAAVTAVVSEAIILGASLVATRRVVGEATDARALAGALACAAAMAAVLSLAVSLPLLVRVALGAAVYGALLVAFRVVKLSDLGGRRG